MKNCLICNAYEEVLHEHHTTPQAYGGKDSRTISICATCHNNLHAHANGIISYRKSGGKNKVKQFWKSDSLEQAATPFVALIVEAYYAADDSSKEYKMINTFDTDTYVKLRFIKKDCGASSLQDALKYCIERAYKQLSTATKVERKPQLW